MARSVTNNEVKATNRTIVKSKFVDLQGAVANKANDISALIKDMDDRLSLLEFPQAVAVEADSPWEMDDFTTDLQTILYLIVQYRTYGFTFGGDSLDDISPMVNLCPPIVTPATTGSTINRPGYWELSGSFTFNGITPPSPVLVSVRHAYFSIGGSTVCSVVIPNDPELEVSGSFSTVVELSSSLPVFDFQSYDIGPLEVTGVSGYARFLRVIS